MGQITIDVPQNVRHHFRLISEDSVKELAAKIEELIQKEFKFDEDNILELWADGKETTPQRSREPRRKSDRLLNV